MKNIKALQLLQKSDSQSVDGDGDIDIIEIESGIGKTSFDKNAIAVSLYANNENYEFEYHFTKQNLMDSKVKGNKITLKDVENNTVTIFCYKSAHCEL